MASVGKSGFKGAALVRKSPATQHNASSGNEKNCLNPGTAEAEGPGKEQGPYFGL